MMSPYPQYSCGEPRGRLRSMSVATPHIDTRGILAAFMRYGQRMGFLGPEYHLTGRFTYHAEGGLVEDQVTGETWRVRQGLTGPPYTFEWVL